MRFTARKLTLFPVLTVVAILSFLMPSYAQNQSPDDSLDGQVEQVQLPRWKLKEDDLLDVLRELCPEVRFFYDESRNCWVAEGTQRALDGLADVGVGPGSPSSQEEVSSIIAILRGTPSVELLAIHYRQQPKDHQKWFNRHWNRYPVIRSRTLEGTAKDRVLNALARDIASGDGSAMCFSPRHVLLGTRQDVSYSITICYECRKVVVEYRDEVKGLPIYGDSAKILDQHLR